jgi:hypothetical protein
VSVLVRPPDVVDREPVMVMFATCADEVTEIQTLWLEFEQLVGLRGRKMYGVVGPKVGTYATCTPVRDDDAPDGLKLQVGEIPGGRFRRGRLRGEPPDVYALVAPGVEELESAGPLDATRAVIEFYKRRGEIELFVPVPRQGSRLPV